MRFNIVRSVKNPALLLRVNYNHKWDFLDNMGPDNWLDLTNSQSTVPKGHDLRTYSLQNKYDLYDHARKKIRSIIKELKYADSYLTRTRNQSPNRPVPSYDSYYKSILINYKHFE